LKEDAIDHCIAQLVKMVHSRKALVNRPPSRPVWYACDVGRPGGDESAFIKATWEFGAWRLEPITEAQYCEALLHVDPAPPGGERKHPVTTVLPLRDRLPSASVGARLCLVGGTDTQKKGPEGPV
jgi:hypothetical protein